MSKEDSPPQCKGSSANPLRTLTQNRKEQKGRGRTNSLSSKLEHPSSPASRHWSSGLSSLRTQAKSSYQLSLALPPIDSTSGDFSASWTGVNSYNKFPLICLSTYAVLFLGRTLTNIEPIPFSRAMKSLLLGC